MTDGCAKLETGPWLDEAMEEESYFGKRFWDHCDGLGLRRVVRAVEGNMVGVGVSFNFNNIVVTCEAISSDDPRTTKEVADELYAQRERKCEEASKAYWTPERLLERERKNLERKLEAERREALVKSAIEKHPFRPNDPEAYQNYKDINSDSYGSGILRYAEGWCAMMECALESGKSVAEAADETVHESDTEGITGFMYGAAVGTLVKFWSRGEALRVWHNSIFDKTGKANEKPGAVVNPAVLTIKRVMK